MFGVSYLANSMFSADLDAVFTAANTALRLGDDDAVNKVRRVVDGFLTPGH